MDKRELVIIGAGPAGLSAAVYTARAGIDTIILGCDPKVAGDYDIDNYFGFPETISGKELIDRGRKQAERFGAQTSCEKVLAVHFSDDGGYEVKTDLGTYPTCGIILATGVSRIRPGIENLNDYEGKGVSYCVSCDGFFYRDKPVAVLGEGIFAANQALELLNYTQNVTVVTQGKELGMTEDFTAKLAENSIPILEKKITRLEGELLEKAVFEDGEALDIDGLFIAMGEASSLDFAYSLGVERNGVFIVADDEGKTNVPGIFAAGDCTGGFLQISVAVGKGAVAARSAISHVKKECRNK